MAAAGSGLLTLRRVFNDHEQVEPVDGVNVAVCQRQIMAELDLHIQLQFVYSIRRRQLLTTLVVRVEQSVLCVYVPVSGQ